MARREGGRPRSTNRQLLDAPLSTSTGEIAFHAALRLFKLAVAMLEDTPAQNLNSSQFSLGRT